VLVIFLNGHRNLSTLTKMSMKFQIDHIWSLRQLGVNISLMICLVSLKLSKKNSVHHKIMYYHNFILGIEAFFNSPYGCFLWMKPPEGKVASLKATECYVCSSLFSKDFFSTNKFIAPVIIAYAIHDISLYNLTNLTNNINNINNIKLHYKDKGYDHVFKLQNFKFKIYSLFCNFLNDFFF